MGRSASCDLALHDVLISRRHAELVVTGDSDSVTIRDLGSANGVFVNDERVVSELVHPIQPGDRIGIGRQDLVLSTAEGVGTATERPTSRPPIGDNVYTEVVPDALRPLSPREREAFVLIAHGLTHKEAAEEMGISVKTVDAYRGNIALKLDLKSRAQIVKLALESGLLGG